MKRSSEANLAVCVSRSALLTAILVVVAAAVAAAAAVGTAIEKKTIGGFPGRWL